MGSILVDFENNFIASLQRRNCLEPAIVNKDIPPRTKHLGPRLLAFILNICDERADEIFNCVVTPNSNESAIIASLEHSLERIALGRFSNTNLEWHDLIELTSTKFGEGRNLFTELRKMSGTDRAPDNAKDDVELALSRMSFECFPFALLPRKSWGQRYPWLPHFFRTPLLLDFLTAVRADQSLMKLFPDGAEGELDSSAEIFTSFGSGSSIQICMLHEQIISSAIALMQLRGQCSVADLQASAIEMLGTLRKVAEGEIVDLPAIDVFDLVGLPDNVEITVRDGKLRGIPSDFESNIPSEARPATSGEREIFGFMLVRQAKFSVFLAPKGHPNKFENRWPIKITSMGDDAHMRVSLGTALALSDDTATAARKTATITIDPINGISVRWSNSLRSLSGYHLATKEECNRIEVIMELIDSVNIEKIRTAIKRYLCAVINRDDFQDSLIDAVIGMENLFGAKAETAFHVSLGVSRLLGSSECEREEIFSETKKFYNARSKVVHGEQKEIERIDIPRARAKAVSYLKRCIVKLLEDRQDAILLDSVARVRKIALENE